MAECIVENKGDRATPTLDVMKGISQNNQRVGHLLSRLWEVREMRSETILEGIIKLFYFSRNNPRETVLISKSPTAVTQN